jgi:hypothetical protein
MSPRRPLRSTVPSGKPAKRPRAPLPPRTSLPLPPKRVSPPPPAPRREVARIIDQSETSLVDVIDNLLNRGVVLNADLILALADVDLIYVRLSALLCAADRVLPPQSR